MISVGSLASDPDFAQSFTVYRKTSTWSGGRPNETETAMAFTGTITVASSTDLEQLPEGDVQKGAIAVYTQAQLVVTNTSGTSDEILWNGNRYRASQIFNYANYGYYKCIAVKMDPASNG